jgi:hypothetical protein
VVLSPIQSVPAAWAALATVAASYGCSTEGQAQVIASLTGTVRAHPSVRSGAETGPNGIDARYTAKVTTATSISDQGVSSDLGFIVFPTNTSSVPMIRNEELILLRAQAKGGDAVGAERA